MRPLRRVALDRRTLLRGGAACLALPWLDAMLPAMTRMPPRPRRALFVFSPNGMVMSRWRPLGMGGAAKPGPTLSPLQPLWQRLTAFSGLTIDGGRSHGDGPGDHARSAASYLTCSHPRKTGGDDLHAGVSVDQVLAEAAARSRATSFASLELGLQRGRAAGVCDSGYSCAYSNSISWRAPDQPVAKETSPQAVFARLFGDPRAKLDQAEQQRRDARKRSLLDLVAADAKSLRRELGVDDRRKLTQYLDAVRELEIRLEAVAASDGEHPEVAVPAGMLDEDHGFPERLALMFEVIRLAFATDRTRVVTLMLGNAGCNRSYRFLGVPEGHHSLSHHGKRKAKLEAVAKIDRFHVDSFARFLQSMAAHADGDGDLLGNSLVLFGSGLGDGNRHNHHDVPMLLCGEGGGAARARGHVSLPKNTPMANLYLSVLRAMGSSAGSFADSKEALPLA
ncbi:MAG: DUF1552 domain-containing protein [Planctomycetota bacterium]